MADHTRPGNHDGGPTTEAPSPPRRSRAGRQRVVPPIRRWVRQTFTREHLGNVVRSLGWVVPLTILIWIYAEREQVKTEPVNIPIEVVSKDADHAVSFAGASMPKVMATLSGPKAKIDAVRDRLEGRADAPPLRIEVNPGVGPGEQRVLAMRLADNKLFADNGVTLTAAQPEWIPVYIDRVVVRGKVPIKPAPGYDRLQPPAFEPPTVTLRGPARALPEDVAVYADLNSSLKQRSGDEKIELKDVKLILPSSDVTVVDRTPVTAVVESAPLATFEIPTVRVRLDLPPGFLDGTPYKLDYLEYNRGVIPSVKVTGPKDAIEKLKQKQTVQIRMVITDTTIKAGTAPLVWEDLPPGVHPDPSANVPTEMKYTLQKAEG